MEELEDDEVAVCATCFNETGLKRRIDELRSEWEGEVRCTFHPRRAGVPLSVLGPIIDSVIREHFGLSEFNSNTGEPDGDTLEDLIYEVARPIDEVTPYVKSYLINSDNSDYGIDPFYDEQNGYERFEFNDFRHSDLWDRFKFSIIHEQRFFNPRALELITEIFDGVDRQKDKDGRSVVYKLRPGGDESNFHRARIAHSDADHAAILSDVAAQMGAPPERKRRPGRMNPAGIPTFYGAFDIDTCLAELRPAVGDLAISAQFRLLRPIVILDVTRFDGPALSGSIFAKQYMQRLAQWTFMIAFAKQISEPISQNDEFIDYIPTQAVAEFLSTAFMTSVRSVHIEGIVCQSAQHPGGKNIALFGDAGRLVSQWDARSRSLPTSGSAMWPQSSSPVQSRSGTIGPGLDLVDGSVRLHRITGAAYQARSYGPEPERELYEDPDEE